MSSQDSSQGSFDGGGRGEMSLDIPRVHQLQRDLGQFAEQAFLWCSSANPAVDSTGGSGLHLNDLLRISGELLVHVSSLGAVASLGNAAPFRTHMTGLEELIDLVGAGQVQSVSVLQYVCVQVALL